MYLSNGHSKCYCKIPYTSVDMFHSKYRYILQSNRQNIP